MPRKATSVLEMAQIARVRVLLQEVGIAPSPFVQVITAAGKTYSGQLLRDVVRNAPRLGGWNAYGVITLQTDEGKIEIDYLDIVTVQKAPRGVDEGPSVWPELQSRRGARAKLT